MYSKVKIGSHSIHPMLVAFPIAFYTAACAAYIFYSAGGQSLFWFRLAYVANIAGVIAGIIAAIPGFIDWAFGIPAKSPAKMTGFFHLALNVSALALFALSAWMNSSQYNLQEPNAQWGVILSVIGLGLTVVAGFFGWKLTSVHHVGVQLTPAQELIDPSAPESSRINTGQTISPVDQPYRKAT